VRRLTLRAVNAIGNDRVTSGSVTATESRLARIEAPAHPSRRDPSAAQATALAPRVR